MENYQQPDGSIAIPDVLRPIWAGWRRSRSRDGQDRHAAPYAPPYHDGRCSRDACDLCGCGGDAILVAAAAHRYRETEAWVAKTIEAVESGDADDFVVLHDGAVIGRVGIWQNNELGVIFARSAWGKGFAREAMDALIERARARGMKSIMADIDPRNVRVAKFLEKLGFQKTGAAKNTYKIGDIWTDSEYLTLDLSGDI